MKRLKWLLGMLSVTILCGVLFQWRVAARLRSEADGFRSTTNNAPTHEEGDLPGTESDEQKNRMRDSNRDLLKLRNEARQLREQLRELASVRAANERLRTSLASGAGAQAQLSTP